MLIKHTITNRDFYKEYGKFVIISVAPVFDGNDAYVLLHLNGQYDFSKTKRLRLRRQLDDGGNFNETFEVTSCTINKITDSTNVTIKYNNLLRYFLTPSAINSNVSYCCEDGSEYIGTQLTFEQTKHICIRDRGVVDIKQSLFCEENFTDLGENFCGGYVLYDNKILYNVIDNEGNIMNITTHKLRCNDVEYDTFVPFSSRGYDNRTFMLILHNDETTFNTSNDFIVRDCRFFEEVGGEWQSHPNVFVHPLTDSINIEVPLSFDFSSGLFHDQLLEDHIEEIKDKFVTKQLDYEKTMFKPVYYNGENNEECYELNSINFNIFLRKRYFFEDSMEWKLASSAITEGVVEWYEDSNAYWNSYEYTGGSGSFLYSSSTENTGDLLGDLGFDDNDVFNQNKRLGKTFIRLLFFDSKDRNTQSLLFYSTIFINTVDLYSKYMNNITLDTFLPEGIEEYVDNYVTPSNLQLSCNFSCFSKYNMSGSSEGYYLYLFPMLVEDGEREIYMRVEFNHAKYGQTVPLVSLNHPKKDYTKTVYYNVNGRSRPKKMTDLTSLYNDMYIPIKIKYCNDKKAFVWYFNFNEDWMKNYIGTTENIGKNSEGNYIDKNSEVIFDNNNPTFNLWEPKIR